MDQLKQLLDTEDQEAVYQVVLAKKLPQTERSFSASDNLSSSERCQTPSSEDLYCIFMSLLPETASETVPYVVDWMFKTGAAEEDIVGAAREFLREYSYMDCRVKYKPFFTETTAVFSARGLNLAKKMGCGNADLLAIVNR